MTELLRAKPQDTILLKETFRAGEKQPPCTLFEPSLEVQLTANETVHNVADLLRTTPPHWGRIMQDIAPFVASESRYNRLLGMLGEIHVYHVLNQAVASDSLKDKLALNPLAGKVSEKFIFAQGAFGNLFAYPIEQERDGYLHSRYEVDTMFEAEGLPVIGEVRITRIREKNEFDSHHYTALLSNTKINRSATVVEGIYGKTLGYMAIVLPEVIDKNAKEEKEFFKKRGILVELPAAYEEFQSRAHELSALSLQKV